MLVTAISVSDFQILCSHSLHYYRVSSFSSVLAPSQRMSLVMTVDCNDLKMGYALPQSNFHPHYPTAHYSLTIFEFRSLTDNLALIL